MTKKELNTKERIMDIAHDLFAKSGFDAVSVREISTSADVNISAINYHFENKLGLFQSVMQRSVESLVVGLEQIVISHPKLSTLEYIEKMFDFFLNNELKLLSSFKFFMSMSEVLKELEIDCIQGDKPPGGEILEKLIFDEYGPISEEDLAWVIRSISALVFHKSIIACNKRYLEQKKKHGITIELFKKDLIRSSKVLLDSLS